MAWNEAVVTNDGLELLARCVLGGSVEITSAVGGESCSPAVSLMAVKEIALPNHNLQVAKVEKNGNTVTVNVRVQNNGVKEAYYLRQIGLFARSEGDKAVLLAVIQDKIGEEIPNEAGNPEFLLEYDFVIPLSNGENISVKVTPNTFATLEDLAEERELLNDHIGNKGNPHSVTKTQVGLGNVPNVATNNQTPTYTAASELSELTSGEKLGTAFGKLAKAVKELITHLADNVRHVTAEERTSWNGKAAGNHTHGEVTQSDNGFMSAADKTKLDGIATGANKYTHPSTAGNKHIPAGGASGQILRWSAAGTAVWGEDNNTTYSAATQSADGLLTAADKKKLDGIAEGANAYTHPAYTARTGVPTANQTPAFGGTFSVSQPVSDANGHITAMTSRTVKIPNTAATASAAGLMSAADKTKLNGITLCAPICMTASMGAPISFDVPAGSKAAVVTVKTVDTTTNSSYGNNSIKGYFSDVIDITQGNVEIKLHFTDSFYGTSSAFGALDKTGSFSNSKITLKNNAVSFVICGSTYDDANEYTPINRDGASSTFSVLFL